MVESTAETVPATPVAASPKKKKTATKAKSGAAKTTATHPSTATMVNNAIKTLNERGGSSLQAIKKSISSTYKVEPEKFSMFIKKYLKSAVEKGELIQTKGKGASGSFKLAQKAEPKKKAAAPKKKKPAAAKKEKSAEPKVKKAKASPKKPAAAKKTAKPKVASKPKPAAVKKTPSKAKPTKPVAAKKPKSPKPKKTVAKKPAAKKTIAKK